MNFIYDENGKQKIINMFGYCFGDTPLPFQTPKMKISDAKKKKKSWEKRLSNKQAIT